MHDKGLRIRRVLGRENHTSRSLGGIAAAALVLSMAGATAIVSVYAAPQEVPPAFEVASIKRDVSGAPGMFFRIIPTLHLEGVTLKRLVIIAYHVHDFQITGGPDWIDSDRYNVDAKAEAPSVLTLEYRDLQFRRLQTLLRDRFHLMIHRETRELPVYALTVAKGGPKLQPPDCIPRARGETTLAPGKKPGNYCGLIGGGNGSGRIQASSATMADFANWLSSYALSRTVVDKTGITGEFQIQLTYTPDTPTAPSPDVPGPRPADPAAAADLGPDIFTAMQEQLGLKLNSSKGPVGILVIDHVERPSEN
jgi:uncharacterized protein (TIGR03435 family)